LCLGEIGPHRRLRTVTALVLDDAYFDLADVIITVRSVIRKAWTLSRWDTLKIT
jgi:hypothetical protein